MKIEVIKGYDKRIAKSEPSPDDAYNVVVYTLMVNGFAVIGPSYSLKPKMIVEWGVEPLRFAADVARALKVAE